MPDNSSFSVDPTPSGGTYTFWQPADGETARIRFLDEVASVSLRGIGDFEVETVDMGSDDRLDLHNLIAENHQRVRQENPWMAVDGISNIWNFRYHEDPPQPVFTREMLNQAWQQIRDEPHQPYIEARTALDDRTREIIDRHIVYRPLEFIQVEFTVDTCQEVQDFWQEMFDEVLCREPVEDEPGDPDAEFTPRQERHFATAKERLDDWLSRADKVLEECQPPEHDHWEVEAHSYSPDYDPDDPECHLYRL